MDRNLLAFFAITLVTSTAAIIMCDEPGEMCLDHEQCCGGCCIEGVCIDTYQSCMTPFDVCHNHVCMGEESCVVYAPPECPGCQPVPLCRII